jgi:glutathione S-transferase
VFQGIKFEDFHYTHTADQQSRKAWLNQKAVTGLDFPNLPYLIDGDFKISDHMAIHRYVAQKWCPDLLGKTLEQRARVDMYAGLLQELKRVATMGCYTDGDRTKLSAQTLSQMEDVANSLTRRMFILGDELCFLDFYMFELL